MTRGDRSRPEVLNCACAQPKLDQRWLRRRATEPTASKPASINT